MRNLQHFLRISKSQEESKNFPIRHVTFEPLDRHDVECLAAFFGAHDLPKFMRAFVENEVSDLMEIRPQDVKALVEYWNSKSRLGSWSEIAKWQLLWTYSETNPARRRRELSLVDYAVGLKRIAAATILSKVPHVLLPTAQCLPNALHASELFPEWLPAKLEELFTSPLFMPKGENAVQLVQGTFAKCLAAMWFESRYHVDQDVEAIRTSLFANVPGYVGLHLADTRRELAGWVATLVPPLRKTLVAVAPDALLHLGDPERLDAEEIGNALKRMVALRAFRNLEWPSYGTLTRLARPELETTIRQLLDSERDPQIIWHLLHFVESNEYRSCLPRVLELAADENAAGEAHAAAVRVVARFGTESDRLALKVLIESASCHAKEVLIRMLFPDVVTAQECARMLVSGCNYSMALAFAEKCDQVEQPDLDVILAAIDGCLSSELRSPHERSKEFNEPSETALAHVACTALTSRIALHVGDSVSQVLSSLPVKVQLAAEFQHLDQEVLDRLNAALQKNSDVRRGVWCEKVRILRRDGYPHESGSNVVAPLSPYDYDWLYSEASRPENADVRDSVLYLIRSSYERLDLPISQEVRSNLATDLAVMLDAADFEMQELRKARQVHADKKANELEDHQRSNRLELAPRLAAIRAGTDRNALVWAWEHLRHNPSGLERINNADLVKLVGDDIADDILTGFAAGWKECARLIGSAQQLSAPAEAVMALTGLAVTYQREGGLIDFGEDDARLAATIATYELNAFPMWFADLASKHCSVVRQVLLEVIAAEWGRPNECHGILRFAPREPESVALLMRDIAVELAKKYVPQHVQTIKYAADAMLVGVAGNDSLGSVARDWTMKTAGQIEECTQCLRLWVHTAPEDAALWLMAIRDEKSDFAQELVARLAACLGEDFHREKTGVSSAFLTPGSQRVWLPLLVESVRPEQDVSPKGFHMVSDREMAQELRGKCLSALVQDGTPESLGVLRYLEASAGESSFKESIRYAVSAHERCAAEIGAQPWCVEDILNYENCRNLVPRSIEGLFELVLRNLRQIGESQESGDFSYRELFERDRRKIVGNNRVELSVQRWVAATLQLVARGVYSVDRESEMQDENKVDICARIPGVLRLPIEIKPIGDYSESDLKSTIELQLIGKYMRPKGASHGILLLVQLEGASRNTVHKELTVIRATLKLAKRRGEYPRDIEQVMPSGFSTDYKPRTRYLTVPEAQRLLAELLPDRAACVAFIIATSARWGEAVRARREDVAPASSYVRLRGTKTEQSDRIVPIVGWAQALIAHALEYCEGKDGLLFKPWDNVRHDLEAACERAGIAKVTPNDLRRTCATWLCQNGVEPHLIGCVLGHSDSRMVERVYGRMPVESLRISLERRLDECSKYAADGGDLERNQRQVRLAERPLFSGIVVPRVGIEPTTRGFSVHCSTD